MSCAALPPCLCPSVCPVGHPGRAEEVQHLRLGAVEAELVPASCRDGRLQIIRNHLPRDAVEEHEHPGMADQKVSQHLAPRQVHERAARRPQRYHEDMRMAHLVRLGAGDGHRLPRIVDEQALAGVVLLGHRGLRLAPPSSQVKYLACRLGLQFSHWPFSASR